MLSYKKLDEDYPNIEEMKPDKQLILFTEKVMESGKCPENIELIIAMLKYLYKNGIGEYTKEFKALTALYNKLKK
ncbi:hypothetical protein UT300012_23030 [Paraclostridium bifermentans]